MNELTGKIALVTGGSKGIGAAIAFALAAAGAKVAINYVGSEADAERVVGRIRAAGGDAVAIRGDVRSVEAVALIAETAVKSLGPIDVLVNNSGVYEYGGLSEVTEAMFHNVFDVDVLGLLLVTKEVVARMNDGGSIINISSAATTNNRPGTLIYCAAKHAVDGITRVLAKELAARRIRVNAVNPGLIDTEGTRAAGFFGSDRSTGFAATASLGRAGQPADIADLVAVLASEKARWVTGECILAEGA